MPWGRRSRTISNDLYAEIVFQLSLMTIYCEFYYEALGFRVLRSRIRSKMDICF